MLLGSTDKEDLQRNLRKTENISFKEHEILSIKRKKKTQQSLEDTVIISRLLRHMDYGSNRLFLLCVGNRLLRCEFIAFHVQGFRERIYFLEAFFKILSCFPSQYIPALRKEILVLYLTSVFLPRFSL